MSTTDTTDTELTVEIPLHEEYPTFDEWCESQEYEYQRDESEAVDYVNTVVDYGELNEFIETNVSFVTELGSGEITYTVEDIGTLLSSMEFERDSTEWEAAKTHLNAYVAARITYYHRRLE